MATPAHDALLSAEVRDFAVAQPCNPPCPLSSRVTTRNRQAWTCQSGLTGTAALRRASPILRVTGDVVAVLCTLQASPGLGVGRTGRGQGSLTAARAARKWPLSYQTLDSSKTTTTRSVMFEVGTWLRGS